MSDYNERALQIGFGLFGVLGTLITLASLHHRDSLGCMLFHRLFSSRVPVTDPESIPITNAGASNSSLAPSSRRTTLPPAYETSTYPASSHDSVPPPSTTYNLNQTTKASETLDDMEVDEEDIYP